MPGQAGQIAKGHPKQQIALTNLPSKIDSEVPPKMPWGGEIQAAIRANGNVFRLAPQTDQQA
jgi:hypothetical protein